VRVTPDQAKALDGALIVATALSGAAGAVKAALGRLFHSVASRASGALSSAFGRLTGKLGTLSRAEQAAARGAGTFGRSSVGAAQRVPQVLQTGGRTVRGSTAGALNDFHGTSHHRRVWGRALEELKSDLQLPARHHGRILDNADYVDKAGNVLGNIADYLP
jgi:filamentous hemagglutinin